MLWKDLQHLHPPKAKQLLLSIRTNNVFWKLEWKFKGLSHFLQPQRARVVVYCETQKALSLMATPLAAVQAKMEFLLSFEADSVEQRTPKVIGSKSPTSRQLASSGTTLIWTSPSPSPNLSVSLLSGQHPFHFKTVPLTLFYFDKEVHQRVWLFKLTSYWSRSGGDTWTKWATFS